MTRTELINLLTLYPDTDEILVDSGALGLLPLDAIEHDCLNPGDPWVLILVPDFDA